MHLFQDLMRSRSSQKQDASRLKSKGINQLTDVYFPFDIPGLQFHALSLYYFRSEKTYQ
jgi:hypothetical protein